MSKVGKVTLVGAGPGDGGLLTRKGYQALKRAQVVVYDRLVGAEVLAMMPEAAEKINVGKVASHHPVPQHEINQILLDKALEGWDVVRLKGGDPFLFGRGGEELELLEQNNVPFEVIPGVTSALSVPCYAGIPVTHRDYCSSIHIITGHAKQDGELKIDFDALVRAGGTMLFLMSVTSMGHILNGLQSAGMPPSMPAAVIEQGTLPGQRKIVADIASLEEKACQAGVKSPAILMVGEVCGLHSHFDWFGALPLKGARVLVTRPKGREGTLTDKLRALGAEAIPYPCIETQEISPNPEAEAALSDLFGYQWLVLTSPAGVQALFHLLDRLDLDARILAPVKIAVIGQGTGDELVGHGIRADFIPEQFDAAHLAQGLCLLAREGERMLLLRAEEASRELTQTLLDAGILYDDIPVYRTKYCAKESDEIKRRLLCGEIQYVTFTSASTVCGFTGSLAGAGYSNICGVCIGASTEKEAKAHGIRTITAKNATIDAMLDIIKEDFQNGAD